MSFAFGEQIGGSCESYTKVLAGLALPGYTHSALWPTACFMNGTSRTPVKVTPDIAYKSLWNVREFVAASLAALVSLQITADLDFDSLERVPTHLIGPNMRELYGDRAWRIKSRSFEAWLIVWVEFQSGIHPAMPIRLGNYRFAYWQELTHDLHFRAVPPFLPLVIYTGKSVWNQPLTVQEMIDFPARGLPPVNGLDFQFVDVHRLDLAKIDPDSLAGVIIRAERAATVNEILMYLQKLVALSKQATHLEDATTAFLIMKSEEWNMTLPSYEADWQNPDLLIETAREYRAKIHAEGHAEGRTEGRTEGRAEGLIESFLRLAALYLSADLVQQMQEALQDVPLEQVPDVTELMQVLDRSYPSAEARDRAALSLLPSRARE